MHIYIYIHIHTCMSVYKCVICKCIYIYIDMCVKLHERESMYTAHVYVCMNICAAFLRFEGQQDNGLGALGV